MNQNQKKNNVVVFGTFDRLHKGHEHFLSMAKQLGDHLTVCLAQDHVVKTLKGKSSQQTFEQRKMALESVNVVDEVRAGDVELSTYDCLNSTDPTIVAIGYDQAELKDDLEEWLEKASKNIKVVVLPSFEPETYKTSLLSDV